MTMKADYPFTAVVGNDELKRALSLCVVDPSIGGVVVEGDRGSAKSTLARGLAQLMSSGQFVNLPLGASEEQLIGSLDIGEVLSNSEVKFKPGLLAKAHKGVLYIDEVNLLADHLTDVLLDVAASGINIVERDGISHQHEARFVLVGSMNPDEGVLRPQLLDRFGFCVLSETPTAQQARKEVVARRLAFEADPSTFMSGYEAEQTGLTERLQVARTDLENVVVLEEIGDAIAELCSSSCCEGLRADITLYKAVRANAALEGRTEVGSEDIDQVKELVLRHRRKLTQDSAPPKRRPSDPTQQQQVDSASNQDDRRHQAEVEYLDQALKEKKSKPSRRSARRQSDQT